MNFMYRVWALHSVAQAGFHHCIDVIKLKRRLTLTLGRTHVDLKVTVHTYIHT
jgi:hypothetical protein